MLALEVVPLPVTDIDRALAFYAEQAGFTLDVDGWTPSVATMPASPTSPTRTATPGPCRNAVTVLNR